MDRSVVAQNRELSAPDPTAFLGGAQGVSIGPGGKVLVRDSALVDNEGGAFFLQEGSAQIDGVVLSRTRSSRASAFAVAITAIHSAVAVRTSTITRNQVALAIRGGRALLRDSLVTDHGDAIRLDGVTFVQTSEAREDAVDMQVIAARTTFARNGRLAIAEPLTGE